MSSYRYINSAGMEIDFHSKYYYSDEHWVYGYEYDVDFKRGRMDVTVPSVNKEIEILIKGTDRFHTAQLRNKLYDCVDRDVKTGNMGHLYVGSYSLECYISGMESEASINHDMIKVTATVIAPKLEWVAYDGEIYEPGNTFDSLVNGFAAYPVDMQIRFYGPWIQPLVTIGGWPYELNTQIARGFYAEIDTRLKTIGLYSESGAYIQNLMDTRSHRKSVFHKVDGTPPIEYERTRTLRVFTIDTRREPAFEEDGEYTPPVSHDIYLLDNAGDEVLDFYAFPIETGGV